MPCDIKESDLNKINGFGTWFPINSARMITQQKVTKGNKGKQMKKIAALIIISLTLTGCSSLTEIRHKNSIGQEFRESSDRNSIQEGLEFSFENGIKTGVSYRYRFTDNDDDQAEHGVWLEFSYPLWKKKKS